MAVAFNAATERTLVNDPDTFSHTGRAEASGGIQGVALLIDGFNSATDPVSGAVTYGGLALTEIVDAVQSSGETANVSLWFKGSGLEGMGGAQTVSIDRPPGGLATWACCITLTGDDDLEVVDSDELAAVQANPQRALSYGGRTCIAVGGIKSGNLVCTELGTMTAIHDHQPGGQMNRCSRQTTPGTSDFTFGYTSTSDEQCMVCAAISEVIPAATFTPRAILL